MGLPPSFSSYTSPAVAPPVVLPPGIKGPLSAFRQKPIPAGNPVPTRFEIKHCLQVKNNVVLWIVYPDAKNYEGNKIILYKGADAYVIRNLKHIDPHFTDDESAEVVTNPFARFEPTARGLKVALELAETL